ncbi:unnamed protein product [Ilex paraguariensis]|uniref:RING-type domain-containing protein n=1 Tax=Ilex paraguariensis TaxID=185542 RepID=A0ABC8TLE2_9AQUA
MMLYRYLCRNNGHEAEVSEVSTEAAIKQALRVEVWSGSYGGIEESQEGGGEGRRSSECSICLMEFKDGEFCCVLPSCNHNFHVHCIENWLRLNKTCPLCRTFVRLLIIKSAQ